MLNRIWTSAVILILVVLAALPMPAENLPAVMLRKQPFFTPVEAVGTGIAPTVVVQLEVDTTGRVAAVDVLSITPSSEYDGLFAEAVTSSIFLWRFAPALEDGMPVASSLSWSLQFKPMDAGPEHSGFMALGQGFEMPGEKSEEGLSDFGLARLLSDAPAGNDRSLRIFSLPIEQQRKHLESLVEKAEQQIDQNERRTAAGNGFAVVTDHDAEGAAEIVRRDLAVVFQMLANSFGEDIPLADSGVPVIAYLYKTQAQYQAFITSVDGIEDTAGYFCPPGLIAFHAERPSRETLLSTIIHEAVHAFMFRHVLTVGHQFPRWLSEGFAEYIGNSRITKKGIQPGERKVTQFYTNQMRVWRGRTLAQLSIDEVKKKIKREQALAASSILQAGRETFYGDSMSLYYAQSWILVHMLQHGEPGWKTAQFSKLMLLIVEGYPVKDAIEQIYDTTMPELDQRYREYARKF